MAFSLVWCIAWRAAADAAHQWPDARRLAVEAELTYTRHSQESSRIMLVSPLVSAHYGLTDRFSLGLDWGAARLISKGYEGMRDDVAVAGNPQLTLYYGRRLETWRWRVGLAGTVPVARAPGGDDGRLRLAAHNWSADARGLWDLWLWAPNRASVALPFAVEHETDHGTWLRLEGAPALTMPIYAFEADVHVFAQLSVALGVAEGPLRLGIRGFGVVMPMHPQDKLQLALEPVLQLALAPGALTFRYTIPVGEPLGQRRGLDVWGAHVGAAWQF